MQYKYKKKLYKILFIVILLSFIVSLVGCNWFSLGLLNIFDPQAQIKVSYTEIDLTEGVINLEIYSLNGVGFNASGFSYDYYYYSGIIKIPIFTKIVEANFYVEPSISPGTPGTITTVDNLPLYFQDLIGWLTSHPLVTEVNCDLNLIGKDTSNHSQTIQVASNLPVLQPGIDFYPPTAVIIITPSSIGYAPFTVAFDASGSFDVGSGIANINWDFGDGTTGTEITENHTYDNSGLYFVTLTVTDFYGNKGNDTVTITVNEPKAPIAVITTVPDPATGITSLEIYFGAYESHVDPDCGFECEIVSYEWDFGDGSPSGTGVNINHTFDTAGTYVTTLTVTDSNGKEGYDTVTITVNEPDAPTAIINTTPFPPTGSAPFTVAFDASDSTVSEEYGSCCSIVNYSWDFGDGSTGTGIITTHSYNTVGLYPVILTVTDSNGKVGYATVVITVTSEVVPGVDNITVNADPQSNAPGGTSSISAIVTDTEGDFVADGTTVYFYTNNGTLSADSAVTTNGIAKVTLTLAADMQDGEKAKVTAFIGAVNGFVEVTCSVAVEVGAKIDTTPSPATGFIPFTVGFDASRSTVASLPIVSYVWTFTEGDPVVTTTVTGVTAVHTFLGNGTYLVKLTVTDSAANVYVAFVTVIANP